MESFQSNTCGVAVWGDNVVIADNDISNVSEGINIYNVGAGGFNDNSFNIYSGNSFHDVGTALDVNANWDGNPSSTNSDWFLGNVFRDNAINGIVASAWVAQPAAIAVNANASVSSTINQDKLQLMINVIDGNTFTGLGLGTLSDYGLAFTSTTSGSTGSPAGIWGTTVINNFFSSDGNASSYEETLYATDDFKDTDSYVTTSLTANKWQDFWATSYLLPT